MTDETQALRVNSWTPEEDALLLTEPRTLSFKELALRVGRSEGAVKMRLRGLRERQAAGQTTNGAAAPPAPQSVVWPVPSPPPPADDSLFAAIELLVSLPDEARTRVLRWAGARWPAPEE